MKGHFKRRKALLTLSVISLSVGSDEDSDVSSSEVPISPPGIAGLDPSSGDGSTPDACV